MTARIWFLTPSYRPVGGVVKILDYVNHARVRDWEVVIACAKGMDDDSPLWRMDAFRGLRGDDGVAFVDDLRIAPEIDDVVFFSWPAHLPEIMGRLPHEFPLHRLIHIVQNTRHANPAFADGWGVRALTRPMTRIVINDQVRDAITPFLNPRSLTEVIPLGHRAEHFSVDRASGLPEPLTVGYTTWKSTVGDRVAERFRDDPGIRFRAIREPADWDELRALYAESDVFLCTPGPQEGFYLPGLEAMAAGCVVLTPDAGGNLAYAFFGENCLEVPFEDADGYAARIREVRALPDEEVTRLRQAGRERVVAHALAAEGERFGALLDRIESSAGPRVRARTPARTRHRARRTFQVLTGVPRSGTTLATHLLNGLHDVVALSEPLRPPELMAATSRHQLLDRIEDFFEDQRRSAIEVGAVESKLVHGRDPDNYVEDTEDGAPRRDLAKRGRLALDREVTEGVHIVVKDLALCTALLDPLRHRFDVTAIVRNPVAILASWDTVAMPVRDGHSPHAEWFCEDLARQLLVDDRRERQLRLLDWWFAQYAGILPDDRVLRYEDLISSGGRCLQIIVPQASDLDVDLQTRNDNAAYAPVDRDELAKLVLDRGSAAWWHYYARDEVEAMASTAIGTE